MVELRDVVSGAPGASVLASASVPAAAVPVAFATGQFVAVPFASPAAVLAGSQYAIVAYTGGADLYHWGAAGDVYAGGALFFSPASPPTTWVSLGAVDFAFKTYVLQDKHAVKDGCDAAKDAAEDGSEEEKEQAEQAKEACPDFD